MSVIPVLITLIVAIIIAAATVRPHRNTTAGSAQFRRRGWSGRRP